jgi:putative NADPH-quinone reductase
MSAYLYTTGDVVVTSRPCRLLSVLVSTDGGGPGKVVLYDEKSAVAGREVATLLTAGNNARHFHWKGLKLHRGLYVDIVEKADYVTVEWEPAGE